MGSRQTGLMKIEGIMVGFGSRPVNTISRGEKMHDVLYGRLQWNWPHAITVSFMSGCINGVTLAKYARSMTKHFVSV